MKYLQRYLSLLFALVMCVGLFSTIAHAEEYKDLSINLQSKLYYPNGGSVFFQYNTNVDNNSTFLVEHEEKSVPMDYSTRLSYQLTFGKTDGSLIAEKGDKFKISIQNMAIGVNIAGVYYPVNKLDHSHYSLALVHTDGTWTYFYEGVSWNYSPGNETHSLTMTITANKDIRKIQFVEDIRQYDFTARHGEFNTSLIMGDVNNPLSLVVDIEPVEVGLLQGIADKVTSGFSAIGDKLTNVFNSITELPQKLWNLISDGLKSLFVPSEESMTAYKDKWDELLASRFGAVYQVVNIMTDSWDGIMQADETDTIDFPQATVNLSGTPFTFGGYSVKIVPDGFGVLVTAIKSIVAIVCTVAFVNGMRKRYDEIMGVEQ